MRFSMEREPGAKFIVRPVTDDGLVGYDQFNQFAVTSVMADGSESSHHITDVRGVTCIICDRGWEPTGPSMADQTNWSMLETLVHLSCFIRHYGLRQRELFWNTLVCDARVRFRGLVAVPNRYWPPGDPWSRQPWYQAELVEHAAMFVFGRRKRVCHVEVVAQGGTRFDWHGKAEETFKDEGVTKQFSDASVMLHAYTDDKLREYVRKISEVAGYVK